MARRRESSKPCARVVRPRLRGRGPRLRWLGGTGRGPGLPCGFHAEAAAADVEAGRG